MMIARTRPTLSPLLIFALALGVWMMSAVIVGALLMSLPGRNLQQLALALSGSGVFTTLTTYIFYRTGLMNWFGSLRWTLLLVTLFTAAQMLINVWMMARLMFVDNQYVTITGIIVLYVGLTAAAFGFFISRAITERLRAVSVGADQVAQGDFTTRLPVRGNDEIAHLTTTFNGMAQALQAADEEKQRMEKNRRDLIAWVSHDLRTPLAAMRVMLEALSDGVIRDEDTFARYLKSSLGEIQHLAHLIDDLFELAQLDVGHLQLDYQPISIPDLISDTLSAMMPKARQRHLTLDGEVADDVDVVQAAPDKIQRVLYNLVSNAIAYTPEGERIRICARRTPEVVEISVQNSGVVIAQDMLPHLFESFYRGDAARAQQNGNERGTGLGLAIARGFVEAHGGKIHATSSETDGTTFTFTIPTKIRS